MLKPNTLELTKILKFTVPLLHQSHYFKLIQRIKIFPEAMKTNISQWQKIKSIKNQSIFQLYLFIKKSNPSKKFAVLRQFSLKSFPLKSGSVKSFPKRTRCTYLLWIWASKKTALNLINSTAFISPVSKISAVLSTSEIFIAFRVFHFLLFNLRMWK